jgi:hypothetical protein
VVAYGNSLASGPNPQAVEFRKCSLVPHFHTIWPAREAGRMLAGYAASHRVVREMKSDALIPEDSKLRCRRPATDWSPSHK